MFNLWKRAYVHTMEQRSIFESKTIIADRQYSTIVIPEDLFSEGGGIVYTGNSLNDVVSAHFDGQISNLLVELTAGSNKWSVVVTPSDYYYLLGCYLKELQFAFKLSNSDLALIAFSYPYDNFYYGDPAFINGFLDESFQQIIKSALDTHEPTGVIGGLSPADLPTEIGYFLVRRGLVPESDLIEKFANAAQLIVGRLQRTRDNDLSEWCVLNTRQFLNVLRNPDGPEVVTNDFSFGEFASFIKGDPNLTSILLDYKALTSPGVDWSSDLVKAAAADIVEIWERLFLFEQVSELRNANADDDSEERLLSRYDEQASGSTDIETNLAWLNEQITVRGSDTRLTELLAEYERIRGTCQAIKYLLNLRNAPNSLDRPLIELLGYGSLSEAMNDKYNKTLLLVAVNKPSATFARFAEAFFGNISQ